MTPEPQVVVIGCCRSTPLAVKSSRSCTGVFQWPSSASSVKGILASQACGAYLGARFRQGSGEAASGTGVKDLCVLRDHLLELGEVCYGTVVEFGLEP